jgi:hypothetical protein
VPELGWQGKTLAIDEDEIEDQNALVFVEGPKGSERTVVRFKVRQEANRKVLPVRLSAQEIERAMERIELLGLQATVAITPARRLETGGWRCLSGTRSSSSLKSPASAKYLPINDALAEEADWVLDRLVEAGVKNLQPDFLDYHRGTMSAYHGARSEILET